jgi:hypothetical protein
MVLLRESKHLLKIRAGKFGIQVGSQQFTVRNLTVNNANTGE